MTAVLIECLLKRIGGSKVGLGGAEYHFRPTTDDHFDPHVALVDDQDHAAILLNIPEAYAMASEGATAPVVDLNASLPKLNLTDTLSDGAIADQYTQAFGAEPAKGMTRDQMIAALNAAIPSETAKPAKPAKKPHAQRAIKAATAVAQPTENGSAFDAMTDDELLAEYIIVFGAEPAADMDREAMTAALKAIPKE